jgi:hypothetical protein
MIEISQESLEFCKQETEKTVNITNTNQKQIIFKVHLHFHSD